MRARWRSEARLFDVARDVLDPEWGAQTRLILKCRPFAQEVSPDLRVFVHIGISTELHTSMQRHSNISGKSNTHAQWLLK